MTEHQNDLALDSDLPPERATAADVRNALITRYKPVNHVVLWEVADGTGASSRRFADAVAVGLWPSHGHPIEGIEIKVSRSDFLHEMKQPEKSQAIFQFCTRWWLACPKGMVKPTELPPSWGLLELTAAGTLRERVKAPTLTPEPMTMAFTCALLRRAAGRDDDMFSRWQKAEVERMRRDHEEWAKKQAELERDAWYRERRNSGELADEIFKATGIDLRGWQPAERAKKAIRFAMSNNFDNLTLDKITALREHLQRTVNLLGTFDGNLPEDDA
jgi:hypothetical protein